MANVVCQLERRRAGLEPYWLLPKVYGTLKWTEIALSKERSFEKFHNKAVTALDLDNNANQFLLSGGSTGSLAIHDVQSSVGGACCLVTTVTGSSAPSAHTHGISEVQWYPHDTGLFTSSSTDHTLRIWDTNEMCIVEKFSFDGPVYSHCMSHSQKHSLIAVGSHGNDVVLCDLQSGSKSHVLRHHKGPVTCVRWSPCNGSVLVSGSQDNKVLFWDVRKARGPLRTLDQHNGGGASSSASVITAHNGHVTEMCFTSDGLFLVTTGTDQRARLWDTFTGTNMLINYGRLVNSPHHISRHIALTPPTLTHRPHLLVPTNSDVSMYELFTGKLVKKLCGHLGRVTDCVVNGNAIEMYTAGTDCNLLLWQPETKQLPKGGCGLSAGARLYGDSWSSGEED